MSRQAWLVVIAGVLLGAAAGVYLLTPRGTQVGPLPAESAAVLGDPVVVLGLDVRDGLSTIQDMLYLGGLFSPEEERAGFLEAKRQIEHALKEVETRSGVKLGRDVEYLVVAASNLGGREPEGVLAVVGHFDAARVFKAVEGAIRDTGFPVETRDVHGTRVLTGLAGGEASFAVPNHRTVLVGSAKSLERALAGAVPGGAGRRTAMDLLRSARRDERFWLAADHRLFESAGRELLRSMEGARLPLPSALLVLENPRSGLEATVDLADAEEARKAAQTIHDKLASAKLEGVEVPATQPLLDVRTDRNTLRIRVTRSPMTGTAGLGIAAAIAIPALLRARVSANESAAIGDIRTVISAQAMYESASGGYGELRCLGEPKSCLPDYDGPTFLDPVLASLEDKNGYRRGFFPGPPGPRPGTYQSYAYTAAPVTPSRTGVRSFCGADDGIICQRMDGQPIAAEDGRCPSDCLPLR